MKLGKPLKLRSGATLKNRAVMAPMTNMMSFFDGTVTKDEIEYYALRSGEIGVFDDRHIEGLAKLSAAIKKSGTKSILQIFHGGRMTHSSILKGKQPVSASAVKAERPDAEEPRALTETEVLEVIEDFKAAAVRAVKAGFDGIEIHGANTYLIQQFFSPHSNRREDQWGGSLEKRYSFVDRLVNEIIEVVEKETNEPFIIGYRFSPEEYENPGIRFEDTLYLVDKLADKELDYLHVSIGNYKQVSRSENYQDKPMIEYINDKINGRVPLISVGDIRTSADAEKALQNSEMVALGRVLLADPHWVSKVLSGREDIVRDSVSVEEREELRLNTGVWGFMEAMMPDRIK